MKEILMYDTTKTVVLYDGITGSTNLMNILSKHPHLSCLEHNPFGSDVNVTSEYCAEIAAGIHEKIFKFRYTGHPALNKAIDHMCKMYNNFIVITRNDTLSHVLSHEIKEQTHQANFKLGESLADIRPFEIDIKRFMSIARDKIKWKESVLKLTEGSNRIVVDYDVIFTTGIEEIYDFLGVDSVEMQGDYQKINSLARYKNVIINLDDVTVEYNDIFKK